MKITETTEQPKPPPRRFTLELSLDEMRALVNLTGFNDDASNGHYRRLIAQLRNALGNEQYTVSTSGYNPGATFREE